MAAFGTGLAATHQMTSTETNKRAEGTQRPPVHRRPNPADLSLAPLVREARADTVERYCGGQANHDEVGWALETYSRFIEAHTAREEELVFPAANRHLNDADWAEVYAAFSGADT